jgi:peptidyl-prolyl cis-trans isomerase SurA
MKQFWTKLSFFFLAFLATSSAFAQPSKGTVLNASGNGIVLTVEDEKVTRDDFEAVFRKNNRDTVVTPASLDEYMELFVNFKLKVREARAEGLDTASSFIRELAGYRKQLARPYLIDNDLLDALVQEAYERKQFEVRASHILIKVDPNASPEDTLRAYKRIMTLRNRILSGESFAEVATGKLGSEDPSVRENRGDLGYFSAFQMVHPFESAAFTTPVGEISMPVRTRFGYHIVKTVDKREARGELRAAHIMLRHKDTTNAEANAEVEARIQEIYSKLVAGEDFGELSMRFSADASTARNGGELPWFGTGKMVESFENAAFALTADGQFSKPVKTSYGWHIIKRLEYKPVPTFAESESEIRKKVSRDTRSDMTRQSFIRKLRTEYGTTVNPKSLKPIYKAGEADSAFASGQGIRVKKQKALNKPLFSIAKRNYTAREFYQYLNDAKIKRRGESGKEIIDRELDKFIETEIMAYEDSQLESKYNDFRLLMSEYHDGILLFELTDRQVWSRAVKDTTGLIAFYEANQARFMWKDRATATVYMCNDEKVARQVERLVQRGRTPIEIKDEINKTSALNVRIDEGSYERGEDDLIDALPWEVNKVQLRPHNGQTAVVVITDVIPAAPKKLDEARGMITAEYQNYLEKAWIDELRAKYKYTIHKDVLHSIR